MHSRELHVEGSRLSSCRLGQPKLSFAGPCCVIFSFTSHNQSRPSADEPERKKKNTDEAPRLLTVIVSFISGPPDRQETPLSPPLFFSFFIWCLRWVESICCLIKTPQPAGRPSPLAERRAAADPMSSLRRLFCTKDVAICFLRGASKNQRHSSICRQ